MRSLRLLGLSALAFVTPMLAQARATAVPEIDPGAAVTALTLVSGAVLMITGRSKRR